MNIGKIIGVGASASILPAGMYLNKLHSPYDYDDGGYCVDDVYNNNPQVSGGTWRRVPPQDSSDYQHDVFVSVPKQSYEPSSAYPDEWE